MSTRIINRERDLKYLEALEEAVTPTQNSISVISADTGVGKTALCTEFMTTRLTAHLGVRANVKVIELSRGYFIFRLASEINRLAGHDNRLVSFSTYTTSLLTPYAAAQHDQQLTSDLLGTSLGRNVKPIATMLRKRLGSYHQNPTASVVFESDQEYWQLFDYIALNAKKTPLAINIENVQALDPLSRDILVELMSTPNRIFFLLEYTSNSDASRYYIDDLITIFASTGADVQHLSLSWLPLRDLLASKRLDKRKLLEQAYYEVNGNLRALKDLEVLIAAEKAHESGAADRKKVRPMILEPTKALVERLPKADLLILSAIWSHKGEIERSLLRVLYDKLPEGFDLHVDISISLERLREVDLIEIANGLARLTHDSIATVIEESMVSKRYTMIAHRAWISHYEDVLSTKAFTHVDRATVLQMLFHLYLQFDISRIWSLMSDIREIALRSKYPKEITVYLEELGRSLPNYSHDQYRKVLWSLADIYYRAGLYEEAWAKVELLCTSSDTPELHLFRVALLDRLDRHEQALSEIQNLRDRQWPHLTHGKRLRFELSLDIIKMVSLRSINEYDRCKQLFEYLQARSADYSAFPEWGFLLRNGEIVLNHRESIVTLLNSIDFFKRLGLQRQEGLSRISLSLYYCYEGKLGEAFNETKLAADLLGDVFQESHVMKNNATAISMYTGEMEAESAIDSYRKCLRTVENNFDKVVILNNMFVAATLADKEAYADDVFASLNRLLLLQPDKELTATVNFNKYFACKRGGQNEGCLSYLELAREAAPSGDLFWDARLLLKEAPPDYPEIFLLKRPFQLAFISHWHFDLPSSF